MYARRLSAIASVLLLASTLAACGGSSKDAGSSDSSAASSEPFATTVSKANQEGVVSWYTSFNAATIDQYLALFNKAYPSIKIQPVRLSADVLTQRLLTEQRAGQYSADVVTGLTYLNQLSDENAISPYNPPRLQAPPESMKLPDGYRVVTYGVNETIAYNPTALAKEKIAIPTGLKDFTQPQWKGKFSLDVNNAKWYDSLINGMGHDAAKALLKGIAANSPIGCHQP
jgi:iron(III) transport system substrate-binding protein